MNSGDCPIYWPSTAVCSDHGLCSNSTCFCYPDWTGYNDIINTQGIDCSINIPVIISLWVFSSMFLCYSFIISGWYYIRPIVKHYIYNRNINTVNSMPNNPQVVIPVDRPKYISTAKNQTNKILYNDQFSEKVKQSELNIELTNSNTHTSPINFQRISPVSEPFPPSPLELPSSQYEEKKLNQPIESKHYVLDTPHSLDEISFNFQGHITMEEGKLRRISMDQMPLAQISPIRTRSTSPSYSTPINNISTINGQNEIENRYSPIVVEVINETISSVPLTRPTSSSGPIKTVSFAARPRTLSRQVTVNSGNFTEHLTSRPQPSLCVRLVKSLKSRSTVSWMRISWLICLFFAGIGHIIRFYFGLGSEYVLANNSLITSLFLFQTSFMWIASIIHILAYISIAYDNCISMKRKPSLNSAINNGKVLNIIKKLLGITVLIRIIGASLLFIPLNNDNNFNLSNSIAIGFHCTGIVCALVTAFVLKVFARQVVQLLKENLENFKLLASPHTTVASTDSTGIKANKHNKQSKNNDNNLSNTETMQDKNINQLENIFKQTDRIISTSIRRAVIYLIVEIVIVSFPYIRMKSSYIQPLIWTLAFYSITQNLLQLQARDQAKLAERQAELEQLLKQKSSNLSELTPLSNSFFISKKRLSSLLSKSKTLPAKITVHKTMGINQIVNNMPQKEVGFIKASSSQRNSISEIKAITSSTVPPNKEDARIQAERNSHVDSNQFKYCNSTSSIDNSNKENNPIQVISLLATIPSNNDLTSFEDPLC